MGYAEGQKVTPSQTQSLLLICLIAKQMPYLFADWQLVRQSGVDKSRMNREVRVLFCEGKKPIPACCSSLNLWNN
jgi:hypothetical protein